MRHKPEAMRMNFPTQVEQDLYDYLGPRAQREVDDYLALEDEAIRLMNEEEPMLEMDENRLRDEELGR